MFKRDLEWLCCCDTVNSRAEDTECMECGLKAPQLDYMPGTVWVNVYLVDRAYGGPEEGGWWYETGKAIRSTQTLFFENDTDTYIAEAAWCDAENAKRNSNINSVRSEGRYKVEKANNPGCDYPEVRPQYE